MLKQDSRSLAGLKSEVEAQKNDERSQESRRCTAIVVRINTMLAFSTRMPRTHVDPLPWFAQTSSWSFTGPIVILHEAMLDHRCDPRGSLAAEILDAEHEQFRRLGNADVKLT